MRGEEAAPSIGLILAGIVLAVFWFVIVGYARQVGIDDCRARGGEPVISNLFSKSAWDVPCIFVEDR
jgi:hypothetical protein